LLKRVFQKSLQFSPLPSLPPVIAFALGGTGRTSRRVVRRIHCPLAVVAMRDTVFRIGGQTKLLALRPSSASGLRHLAKIGGGDAQLLKEALFVSGGLLPHRADFGAAGSEGGQPATRSAKRKGKSGAACDGVTCFKSSYQLPVPAAKIFSAAGAGGDAVVKLGRLNAAWRCGFLPELPCCEGTLSRNPGK